jgi:microbial collagenase
MYQAPYASDFAADVWNLNHEFTHYLDAVYDMKGDFTAQTSVADVWWIEGVAEYVSYTYRGVPDTEALTDAPLHTYSLSTLFQNTYAIDTETRSYPWGYLAVRYMLEKHPDLVSAMLGHFRAGDYTGGYAVYNNLGTTYDADFTTWLDSLGGTVSLPTCTAADPRAMGQNCRRSGQAATTGNTDYLYIWLPAGTATLTVATSGGTGTTGLYYDPDTWAGPGAYTAASTGPGTAQSLTVTNTAAGYRYISLYAVAGFSGVTVTTRY